MDFPFASRLSHAVFGGLKKAIKTTHGRLVLLGLLVGLFYLPQWLGYLIPRAFNGKIGWFLIFSLLGMAGLELWTKRSNLERLRASEEDQMLGYTLIVASAIAFPFCRFALWSQAMVWLTALIGMVACTWGLRFFSTFMVPTFFIALTVYPRVGLISRGLWDFFTPYLFLERTMAKVGSLAMQAIGFAAEAKEQFIIFPEGAVEVGWGCNGLDMAITVALAALVMGLLYQQQRHQMTILISCAVVISLIANIPRLVLVSIAYVYWGPAWFQFWHGFWGGQIFSGILFTGYYYVALGLINRTAKQNELA